MESFKLAIAAVAAGICAQSALAEMRENGAEVTVQDLGEITVHSYSAPQEMFADTTYIIESENALVLIDGQMFVPFASDYRAYADSLGKPIDRVILTHGHPDHYLGLFAFADLPIHAPAATIAEITETGEETRAARAEMMGDVIPDRVTIPGVAIEPGTQVIDGVTYDFSLLNGGEHDPMLITRLPDHGVISVGDVAMNEMHLFLAGNPDTWAEALRALAAEDGYDVVLPGHGLPGGPSMYATNISYLETASELMGQTEDADTFRAGMVEAFPDLGMVAALDFFLPYLFPEN